MAIDEEVSDLIMIHTSASQQQKQRKIQQVQVHSSRQTDRPGQLNPRYVFVGASAHGII